MGHTALHVSGHSGVHVSSPIWRAYRGIYVWSGSGGGAGIGLHAPRGGDFNDERCGEHGREARPPPRYTSFSHSLSHSLTHSLSESARARARPGPTHQHTSAHGADGRTCAAQAHVRHGLHMPTCTSPQAHIRHGLHMSTSAYDGLPPSSTAYDGLAAVGRGGTAVLSAGRRSELASSG